MIDAPSYRRPQRDVAYPTTNSQMIHFAQPSHGRANDQRGCIRHFSDQFTTRLTWRVCGACKGGRIRRRVCYYATQS
jgi:hypothetical protein